MGRHFLIYKLHTTTQAVRGGEQVNSSFEGSSMFYSKGAVVKIFDAFLRVKC